MHRRVRAHEPLSPVRRRPFLVVPLLFGGVVQRLVTKEGTERIETEVLDQPVPEVMADLVSEVTEECAIGLAHLLTRLLAKRIVSFGDVDGDEAFAVTSEDRLGG